MPPATPDPAAPAWPRVTEFRQALLDSGFSLVRDELPPTGPHGAQLLTRGSTQVWIEREWGIWSVSVGHRHWTGPGFQAQFWRALLTGRDTTTDMDFNDELSYFLQHLDAVARHGDEETHGRLVGIKKDWARTRFGWPVADGPSAAGEAPDAAPPS